MKTTISNKLRIPASTWQGALALLLCGLLATGCPAEATGNDAGSDGGADSGDLGPDLPPADSFQVLDHGPDLGAEKPLAWATVKAGTFKMGSPTSEKCRTYEELQHDVTLTNDVRMSTTEVSQAQWYRLMRYLRAGFEGCGPDCPVENVSWHEAAHFCNKMSEKDGVTACYSCTGNYHFVKCEVASAYKGKAFYGCPGYRLPTEAEWEYAYRAGTTTAYYSGDAIGCGDTRDEAGFPDATKDPAIDQNAWAIAWYTNSADGRTHPGGERQANAWGLYDMAGNVWEWVNDWRAPYSAAAVTDPTGPDTGSYRVMRGGDIESMIMYLRASYRHLHTPEYADQRTGFRIAQTVK
jgi:formylglycine-generating enzyme required for sulfatase activity